MISDQYKVAGCSSFSMKMLFPLLCVFSVDLVCKEELNNEMAVVTCLRNTDLKQHDNTNERGQMYPQ